MTRSECLMINYEIGLRIHSPSSIRAKGRSEAGEAARQSSERGSGRGQGAGGRNGKKRKQKIATSFQPQDPRPLKVFDYPQNSATWLYVVLPFCPQPRSYRLMMKARIWHVITLARPASPRWSIILLLKRERINKSKISCQFIPVFLVHALQVSQMMQKNTTKVPRRKTESPVVIVTTNTTVNSRNRNSPVRVVGVRERAPAPGLNTIGQRPRSGNKKHRNPS